MTVKTTDTRPTPEDRARAGKAARKQTPRSSHSEWKIRRRRAVAVELLEQQAVSRVLELVPIRYGRMISSPFAFYRGAALIMASDLARTPTSGFIAQICGDAHMANFGLFASPERELVFDVNDFDETLPGPWEWDVKRLAASLEIAGRSRSFSERDRTTLVRRCVRRYREEMAGFAAMTNLQVWYSRLDAGELRNLAARVGKSQAKRTRSIISRAESHDSNRAFSKLCSRSNGRVRFASNPPLLVPIEELVDGSAGKALLDSLNGLLLLYRRSLDDDKRLLLGGFEAVDLARKVVGVGSVGTRCWAVLLCGRDPSDPLILQAKEAEASVLESFVGKSDYDNHGQRVVEGQRIMQAVSDILLGCVRAEGVDGKARDFYVRQLWDGKGSYEVEGSVPSGLAAYGEVCAWTLARAHARSGDRIAISSYLGSGDAFDVAIAEFARSYADQSEADFSALVRAVNTGQVTAETGV